VNTQNVWVLPEGSSLRSRWQKGYSTYHIEGCALVTQAGEGYTIMAESTALKIGHAPAPCACLHEARREGYARYEAGRRRRALQKLEAVRWDVIPEGARIVTCSGCPFAPKALFMTGKYLGRHGGKQVPFLRGDLHLALRSERATRYCDGKRGKRVWAMADAYKKAVLPCVGCPFAPNAEAVSVTVPQDEGHPSSDWYPPKGVEWNVGWIDEVRIGAASPVASRR
jgi:hypothetical protein